MSFRVNKKKNYTESGIANASKENMREFLMAVLVDNDKQQRMMGLQDQDIAEIYEQSVEIMAMNEMVSHHSKTNVRSWERKSLSMRSAKG